MLISLQKKITVNYVNNWGNFWTIEFCEILSQFFDEIQDIFTWSLYERCDLFVITVWKSKFSLWLIDGICFLFSQSIVKNWDVFLFWLAKLWIFKQILKGFIMFIFIKSVKNNFRNNRIPEKDFEAEKHCELF